MKPSVLLQHKRMEPLSREVLSDDLNIFVHVRDVLVPQSGPRVSRFLILLHHILLEMSGQGFSRRRGLQDRFTPD